MQEPYHYTESGLDNVYLHNIHVIQDIAGEKVIYIPRVNQLHKLIAQAIINKTGLISGKEVRFLRSEMGYFQKDFSKILEIDEKKYLSWEEKGVVVEKSVDALLRLHVSAALGIPMNIERNLQRKKESTANDNIDIDGANNDYKLMLA